MNRWQLCLVIFPQIFPFLLLLLLLLPLSSSERHTGSSVSLAGSRNIRLIGGLRAVSNAEQWATVRPTSWLHQPPPSLFNLPRNKAWVRSSNSRCWCTGSKPGAGLAPAPSGNNKQDSPCRLLGGGVSLDPSLVFALAARRLLHQELQQLCHPGSSPPATEDATTSADSAAIFTPVTVEGGSGGNGSIAFLRLKAAPRSGAAGGSGGRGGCVLLRAVGAFDESAGSPRRLSALRESGSWKASSGGIGAGQGKTGVRRTVRCFRFSQPSCCGNCCCGGCFCGSIQGLQPGAGLARLVAPDVARARNCRLYSACRDLCWC